MPTVRRPYAGQITTVTSPIDPDVTFDIKKCGVAENIARQNLSSKVRYIQEDVTGNIVSERDFPMGDLQLETIFLALAGWNLTDENERAIAVTRPNIEKYLAPKEFDFLYQQTLEINPIWRPGGEDDTKDA